MKTLKEWSESNVKLSQYLTEPCQVDYDFWLYLAEPVVPQFSRYYLHYGDPHPSYDDINGNTTLLSQNGNYYYLGFLPANKI